MGLGEYLQTLARDRGIGGPQGAGECLRRSQELEDLRTDVHPCSIAGKKVARPGRWNRLLTGCSGGFTWETEGVYIRHIYAISGFKMMETAKLFVNGNSQAVRLPKEYRFRGDEVVIKRMGNAVVLLPKDDPWQVMFDALAEFPEDFSLIRDQPELQEREPIA